MSTILMPLASAYEEIELQAATDALPTHGLATVDHTFWRSSFGAPLIGGPTFAGNVSPYDAFRTSSETSSGGTFPTGALPVFIEFQSLANVTFAGGNGSDTDYATQRWTSSAGDRLVSSASLGAGAAAQAAWAQDMLRTNHFANGTQDPAGTFLGASDDSGLLGLFLVQALSDRVAAIIAGGAYNGSGLQAFDLTDGALTDSDPSNGWQLVPDEMGVTLSGSDFQGFTASDNASSLRGQAALILGLAQVVYLSDPAGDYSGVFDGSPFDSTAYENARALLSAVANNAQAYHWDATASAYNEPDRSSVDTGDLALFARALAVAEWASSSNATQVAELSALREGAFAALAAARGTGGRFAASYTVSGATVTPDFASTSLWAQAQAVEAYSAQAAVTGLKVDYDAALLASAGLESGLYRSGSYAARTPEPASTSYSGNAVGALVGALRDLALTGEEPLAVYRFVDAFDTLVDAPPLTLTASQSPPIVGASFNFNSTSSTASPASGFDAFASLMAAFEFVSTGARFNADVGGGVSISESAAVRLHGATAAQVGTALDALDAQVADLQGQLAALQALFDAINSTASEIEARLNLSLINETVSAGRIQNLIDNVTALRALLNQSSSTTSNATSLYSNISKQLNDTRVEVSNLTLQLAEANNATSKALGDLNVSRNDISDEQDRADQLQDNLNKKSAELSSLQIMVGAGVLGGLVAGFLVFYFVSRFVMAKPMGSPKPEGEKKSGDEEDEEDS